ncbi:MAG: hypothetical protein U1E22_07860, partial [Coriobacteriia bacterium]|nr:hypothetical protein [Coriobacteriia bacterium]
RLDTACTENPELAARVRDSTVPWPNDLVKAVADACRCEVRLYDLDPIAFLMIFTDSLFTEQYHLGRPDSVPWASCIGKHVPVIEYEADAEAAEFLRCHFNWLWSRSAAQDETTQVVERVSRGPFAAPVTASAPRGRRRWWRFGSARMDV